jgi:branched-chain amino acid transport system permease protein
LASSPRSSAAGACAALGLFNAFATYFFGGQYQQKVAVGLLILVLFLVPEGLFGSRQVRPI